MIRIDRNFYSDVKICSFRKKLDPISEDINLTALQVLKDMNLYSDMIACQVNEIKQFTFIFEKNGKIKKRLLEFY